jgi:hypothetical protein
MKRAMPISLTVLLFACVSLFVKMQTVLGSSPSDEPGPSETNSMQMQKILTDQRLWGQYALALFATLDRWKNGSKKTGIAVGRDLGVSSRIVGQTRAGSTAWLSWVLS